MMRRMLSGFLNTCVVNQNIDSESYVLASPLSVSVQQFYISKNINVEYLPRQIGKTFPNLLELRTTSCGITVVHDYFFEGMKKLQVMVLYNNRISKIESKAFSDLISVTDLILDYNAIETLDNDIFIEMIKMERISLDNNKIKFMRPTIFNIPRGNLERVYLAGNVCVNKWFGANNDIHQVEHYLKENCTL